MNRKKPTNTRPVVYEKLIGRTLGEEIFGVSIKEQEDLAKAIGIHVGLFVKVDSNKWIVTATKLKGTTDHSAVMLDAILAGSKTKLQVTDAVRLWYIADKRWEKVMAETKALLILRENAEATPGVPSKVSASADKSEDDANDEEELPKAENAPWSLCILGPTERVADAKKIFEGVMVTITMQVPLGVIILLELSLKFGKIPLGNRMSVVFITLQETAATGTVLIVGRTENKDAAINLIESIIVDEPTNDDTVLSVNFFVDGNKVNEAFPVKRMPIPALKAKWMCGNDLVRQGNYGAMAEKKRFERPAGTFIRLTEDWRNPPATVHVLVAGRTANDLEKAEQKIEVLVKECEVDTEDGVSAETAEFIFGHYKGENIRELAEMTNTLIYRHGEQDTTFHLAGRRDDIKTVKGRFKQCKHVVVNSYVISFMGSSYVTSVRSGDRFESDRLQIHCKPEKKYKTGKAVLRLLHSFSAEEQVDDGIAEQAFLSVKESLDLYEMVLQGPIWLSTVVDASFASTFKSDHAYNVHTFATTKSVNDTVLVIFAGSRNATLSVLRKFMEKLKQSEHDASDVFICEIAKEDSLAFLDSSLPVDGDPSDTMPLPELEETVEESYYWSRLTGRRWRLNIK